MPNSANIIPSRSHTEPGLSALRMPSGMPMRSQIATAPAVTDRVFGNACSMVPSTGCWLTYEKAPVAADRACDEAQVLHRLGLVEPQPLLDLGDGLRGGVLARDQLGRFAGHGEEDDERRGAHDQEHHHAPEQAAHDEEGHATLRARNPGDRASRRPSPTRLKLTTVRRIASPGKSVI